MRLFLDTADVQQIHKGFATGLIDGVTTNPSLIKKAAGKHLEKHISDILTAAKSSPVSLEVKGGTAQEMIAQGKSLYRRFKKKRNTVVIKIPINPAQLPSFEGIEAIRKLSSAGIPVNVTLIFTPEQALLAAKAGAIYVSPFVGRIDDMIRKHNAIPFKKQEYFPFEGIEKKGKILEDNGIVSGVDLVKQIVDIFANYNIKTQVLAASLRTVQSVRECAFAGADIATIPYEILEDMTSHPLTREGMKGFLSDTIPAYEKLMR